MLKITAVDWLEKSIVTCTYLKQGTNFDTLKQRKYEIPIQKVKKNVIYT